MKVHNQVEYDQWKANQHDDAYGLAIFAFAETWAGLMEPRVEAGEMVQDIAEETEEIAIKGSGLTGFMYSAAAQILAKCWVHGEPFRHWFNLRHQLGDEGERANAKGTILNLAMLNMRGD
jgi:hypothetical protein